MCSWVTFAGQDSWYSHTLLLVGRLPSSGRHTQSQLVILTEHMTVTFPLNDSPGHSGWSMADVIITCLPVRNRMRYVSKAMLADTTFWPVKTERCNLLNHLLRWNISDWLKQRTHRTELQETGLQYWLVLMLLVYLVGLLKLKWLWCFLWVNSPVGGGWTGSAGYLAVWDWSWLKKKKKPRSWFLHIRHINRAKRMVQAYWSIGLWGDESAEEQRDLNDLFVRSVLALVWPRSPGLWHADAYPTSHLQGDKDSL